MMMCPGGSVPALMLSRSRRSHGGGAVCRWGWRTQQSAVRRSGGGNPVGHSVGCSSGNNIDNGDINNDNINNNDMMTEMMMRTDDDPNYITTNQTRTRTRMRMRMRTMTTKTMMTTMAMTRTRTMTDNKDDNDDHEDLTFLTQQPTY